MVPERLTLFFTNFVFEPCFSSFVLIRTPFSFSCFQHIFWYFLLNFVVFSPFQTFSYNSRGIIQAELSLSILIKMHIQEYQQNRMKYGTSIGKKELAIRIMELVYALHSVDILHGDIKPDNFMVVGDYRQVVQFFFHLYIRRGLAKAPQFITWIN